MEKKFVMIGVIIIIAIILVGGYFALNGSFAEKIEVGSVHFNMPKGYHIDQNQSTNDDVVITNGSNILHLSSYDEKYITPFIESYVNYATKMNQSVSNSTLKINDILVYKFQNSDTRDIHEWFVYNDKVYSIFGWGVQNFDGVSFELIESIS